MNNFIHNGKIVSPDDEVLTQAILQECYQKGIRPICACLPQKNIEMYIAKIGENFVLLRKSSGYELCEWFSGLIRYNYAGFE